MIPQKEILAAALVLLILVMAIWSFVRKRRDQRTRNSQRKRELILQPKEEIKVICDQREGSWIITNKRLLIETGDAFLAYPFSKIKSLSGLTAEGKKTTAPTKMVSITIKAGNQHTLHNRGPEFLELVKYLKRRTAKPRKKS